MHRERKSSLSRRFPRFGLLPICVGLVATTLGASCGPSQLDAKESKTEWNDHLIEGVKLNGEGKAEEAISNHFNPIIVEFQKRYNSTTTRYYSASSDKQGTMYLLMHQFGVKEKNPGFSKPKAQVIAHSWAEAYFFKGYALAKLKDFDGAEAALIEAVHLSPMNTRYLSLIALVHMNQKEWKTALDYFEDAAFHVSTHANPASQITKDTKFRIWKGMGECLLRVDNLERAVRKYRLAAELRPDDEPLKAELQSLEALAKEKGIEIKDYSFQPEGKRAAPAENSDPCKDERQVVPRGRVNPYYPAEAALFHIEGAVRTQFNIDENGHVKNIEVINSSPPFVFDKVAVEALEQWRYAPKAGTECTLEEPVRVTLRFNLEN